ncbi:MAG: universal stress protein [Acidimicrobiia bacterium]|nr:universal stress protein [Acidimicrobiia bacterium]
MVATDGSLDVERTAMIAGRLAGDTGRVTVFTVVEVPRKLLADMRGQPVDKLQEVSIEYRRGPAVTDPTPTSWIGDDEFIERYVARVVETRTAGFAEALSASGVDYDLVGEEGENAAKAIIDSISVRAVDILCVGTHGGGLFEGLLGSTSTKLARRAECSVLLVR